MPTTASKVALQLLRFYTKILFQQDTEQEKWMMRAMYRAKYPDIAKLMDQVRVHFPQAKLVKVRDRLGKEIKITIDDLLKKRRKTRKRR